MTLTIDSISNVREMPNGFNIISLISMSRAKHDVYPENEAYRRTYDNRLVENS